MTGIFKTLVWVAATASFWLALTSSLTGMTEQDCKAGVPAACEQLLKSGISGRFTD